MCGRAILTSPAEEIAEIFGVDAIEIGPPRFNVAPTQPILTVRAREGHRELALVRWGLIPWWAKPEEAKRIGSRCVQARAETAPRAPAFRDAFKRHRCLVVLDGFYEWKTTSEGRQPHLVRNGNGRPLAIAGLWDGWRPPAPEDDPEAKPEKITSAAVLTTHAAGAIEAIHDRMPLVLPEDAWDAWLDGTDDDARAILSPPPDVLSERAGGLVAQRVSTWVNDVKHEDARCIEPFSELPAGDAAQIDLGFADRPARKKKVARR
jgi:putative SOS response-associated peptidase YedK